MLRCRIVNALYSLIPLNPWRDFLIRAHLEKCPDCRRELAGRAEVRSLLVQETEAATHLSLWPSIERALQETSGQAVSKSKTFPALGRWRWAAAGIVLAVLAGFWAWKDFRPDGAAPGAAGRARLELEYVRVGGQPADAYVYQPQGSDIVIVWAGKAHLGGQS